MIHYVQVVRYSSNDFFIFFVQEFAFSGREINQLWKFCALHWTVKTHCFIRLHCTAIAFLADTANDFSLVVFNERKKLIGTPKFKTNFLFSEKYLQAIFFLQLIWTVIFSKPSELLMKFQGWELSISYHLVINYHANQPYTSHGWDFVFITHFAQLWLGTLNHSHSGYGVMLYNAKTVFWPLYKMSMDEVCFKLP